MAINFNLVVQYLWLASVLLQLVVLGILILRGHIRRLPFFTTYILLNLCQAALLYAIYARFGKYSHQAYAVAWWSEAITLLARVCATIEILRLVMISYRGIWGLVWRLLTFSALLVLIGVAAMAHGDAGWALMEADRGFHLIFATALIACLVLQVAAALLILVRPSPRTIDA